MRLPGSDQKEIYNIFRTLNEAGPVANMGSGTSSSVRYNDIGNQSSGVDYAKPSAVPPKPGVGTPGVGPVSPENEETEIDADNIEMAKAQLLQVADNAIELFDLIHNQQMTLEPWVASKITLGLDYIETAKDYMKYSNSDIDVGNSIGKPVIEIETDLP